MKRYTAVLLARTILIQTFSLAEPSFTSSWFWTAIASHHLPALIMLQTQLYRSTSTTYATSDRSSASSHTNSPESRMTFNSLKFLGFDVLKMRILVTGTHCECQSHSLPHLTRLPAPNLRYSSGATNNSSTQKMRGRRLSSPSYLSNPKRVGSQFQCIIATSG
jgi:hypothetical protein